MQSGISASVELQDAFKQFVSIDSQRALFASIDKEKLIPSTTIPLQNPDFLADLAALQTHLSTDRAAYILLKTHPGEPNGYAAITFVPNSAPVRQKTLFASTRLTLVRELGIERFRETIFATEKDELTAAGWTKHQAHERLAAPLTEEETGLKGVKDAEASESQGTGVRRGHVPSQVNVKTREGVVEAIGLLREEGCRGTLIQLKLLDEMLTLESTTDDLAPAAVSAMISTNEPRYSFYSHPDAKGSTPEIWFIYTCPSSSKIRERMVYSTGKGWTRILAERDAKIVVSKSLEATDPADLVLETPSAATNVASSGPSEGEAKTTGGAFARPKRPGRR